MLSGRAVSAALVLAIGLLPMVPAEHVHDAESADGHHEVVAHRHFGLHHGHPDHHAHDDEHYAADDRDADHHDDGQGVDPLFGASDVDWVRHDQADEDHDHVVRSAAAKAAGPIFDDDDSVVATREGLFVAPSAFVVVAPVPPSWRAEFPSNIHAVGRVVPVVERLIHGPPRAPTLLRGPPSSSRL